jgi:hypothetical protein
MNTILSSTSFRGIRARASALALALGVFGCSSSSGSGSGTPSSDAGGGGDSGAPTGGFIGSLTITTIGSTVDPKNGDQNPYGLAIAPITAGKMTAGDLIICNFNDSANVQGNGTTIEILHPTPGSTPVQFVQDPNLKGCAALAPDGMDNPWAAAYSSDLAPFYTASGSLVSTLSAGPWSGPWGEIFAVPPGGATPSFFVTSNATSGTLVNVNVAGTTFTTTVTGFSINAGAVPGTIYGAAGLTYDGANDILYVVDSNLNRVVAFAKYSTYGASAVTVGGAGFTGPSAASASVVFSGAPLNSPISAALLFNGDLVVGNTGDADGTNLLIEIAPDTGKVVGTQNVDTGAAGALFGIATSGTTAATAKIYFNDDNDNTVKVANQ